MTEHYESELAKRCKERPRPMKEVDLPGLGKLLLRKLHPTDIETALSSALKHVADLTYGGKNVTEHQRYPGAVEWSFILFHACRAIEAPDKPAFPTPAFIRIFLSLQEITSLHQQYVNFAAEK